MLMLEGARLSQPEQQHGEEKHGSSGMDRHKSSIASLPLLIFLRSIDLNNKLNLDMDLDVIELQIPELPFENPRES